MPNVFKMLKNKAPDDRAIDYFPTPFKHDATPYKNKGDFNEDTRRICLNESRLILANLKLCKVIILGDVSVGKTSIVNRFCHKFFDCNYKTTIGVDFEVERFDILGIPFNLQIWDTAGQERFKCIAQSYYRGAHVIVIAFDLTTPETLSHCKIWMQEALDASSSSINPYLFLVGTKKDLLMRHAYKNMEINAIRVAKKLKCEFWALSSKTGENINNFFHRIAALAFDDCIIREMERPRKQIQIGDGLISFKKNVKQPEKSKCEGSIGQCLIK